ncbi:TPA: DUF1471 domain-containing protein, partial [Escherichia coli]|nr:DUF1471 domain-containing protein [Escherichia coli]
VITGVWKYRGKSTDIARKYNASSWKVTSMRIDNNSTATAVLYK